MLQAQLAPLATAVGQVIVCEIDIPEWGATGPDRYTHAYVAVITRPTPLYEGARLGMIVKVHDPRKAPAALREDPPPSATWLRAPLKPTVADAYARPSFRVRDAPQGRPAVQVGRQLVQEGLLLRHSTARSKSGSAWAEAVGGDIPPLEEDVTSNSFGPWAERELDRLEHQPWWQNL
ncbi:hypothetical protein [Streptomyces sp. C1-2]|uniref:hypothetical protein n=1 Tax=Streptomyces sp. C1-2 TaxID=2720022 RepID=UPI0014324129|nr:hypothetical protein [Streptomyces sp. C1-2]NJP75272.1 hypothetical protein [Streptomyces sp. C1-2]